MKKKYLACRGGGIFVFPYFFSIFGRIKHQPDLVTNVFKKIGITMQNVHRDLEYIKISNRNYRYEQLNKQIQRSIGRLNSSLGTAKEIYSEL